MRVDALCDRWPTSHDALPRTGMSLSLHNIYRRIPSFSIQLLMQLVIHYFSACLETIVCRSEI